VLDGVVRARLHEPWQLLLDHLLEVLALEVDEEEVLVELLFHLEPHELGLAHDLFRSLLEGDVKALLPLVDPVHDELYRERRLPRARGADDHVRGLLPESTPDQGVQSADARSYQRFRHSSDLLWLPRASSSPKLPHPPATPPG